MSNSIQLTEEQRRNCYNLCTALRSGKYVQSNSKLVDLHSEGARYCCLGVGEQLIRANMSPQDLHDFLAEDLDSPGTETEKVTKEFQQTYGLPYPFIGSLAALNDQEIPFPAIAEAIHIFVSRCPTVPKSGKK